MYEINKETETLVRSTELCLKRGRSYVLNFRLHETLSPVVDNKFVAFPTPLQGLAEPKAQYVVRGNNETDVINKFIALTRDVKRFHSMFEDTNQSEGE